MGNRKYAPGSSADGLPAGTGAVSGQALVPKEVGKVSGHANNQIVEARTRGGYGKVAAIAKVATTVAICVILPHFAVVIGALGMWKIGSELMYFCRAHKNHAATLIKSVKRCFVGGQAKEAAQPSSALAEVGKVTVSGVVCAVIYFCVYWILPIFVYVGVTVIWDHATGQRRLTGTRQQAKSKVSRSIEATEQIRQPARTPLAVDANFAGSEERLNLMTGGSSTGPIITEIPGDDELEPDVAVFADGVSKHFGRWVPASGRPSEIWPTKPAKGIEEILRDLPDISVPDMELEKLKRPMIATQWAQSHEEISQLLITAIDAHGGSKGDNLPSTFIDAPSASSAIGDSTRQLGS
ncbi:MAG: hypothetical protein ACTJLL_04815 [Anaplasma sp.]